MNIFEQQITCTSFLLWKYYDIRTVNLNNIRATCFSFVWTRTTIHSSQPNAFPLMKYEWRLKVFFLISTTFQVWSFILQKSTNIKSLWNWILHIVLLDRGTREINYSSKWNLKDLNEFDRNGFKETLVWILKEK